MNGGMYIAKRIAFLGKKIAKIEEQCTYRESAYVTSFRVAPCGAQHKTHDQYATLFFLRW
jgi:hypothetical protein